MSSSVMRGRRGVGRQGAGRQRLPALAGSFQSGVGLFEFLIALMIFSTGVVGLLSVQLVGMKATHEATQRSVATALARDILERIQANPLNIATFMDLELGATDRSLSVPGADCDSADCSTAQLAAFDLWQWESLLLGAAARHSGSSAGGLRSPLACITGRDGMVVVVISWQSASSSRQPLASACQLAEPAAEPDFHEGIEGEDSLERHELRLISYVAGQ